MNPSPKRLTHSLGPDPVGAGAESRLPWAEGSCPLMLAPMQGLTNRGLREVFAKRARPDLLFTEFVKVRPGAKQLIANSDLLEAQATHAEIPLVVQLIGAPGAGVVEAAKLLAGLGVKHINLNMGCPFGRMKSELAGGGMFRHPQTVLPLLEGLRPYVLGSLSVKTRAGFDDPEQILELVPAFEAGGVDFLVLHARTVKQKYEGPADHEITRALVAGTKLPVIANGDICSAQDAERVLAQTGAAGLMLGRGAIVDPLLFERIRGRAGKRPGGPSRKAELAEHLLALLAVYRELFCGEVQVVSKLKETLRLIQEPALKDFCVALAHCKDTVSFEALCLR